jgi:hypothetical protein
MRAHRTIRAGDDRLRLRGEHGFDTDPRRRQRERREDVLAAAHGERLRNEMMATDGIERNVPDFVEHAHRLLSGVSRGQLPELRAEFGGARSRDRQGARERTQAFHVPRDAVDRRRIRDEDGNAARGQRPDLRRRGEWPRHDQVGVEQQDPLQVERARVADLRLRQRFRRPVGSREDADDAIARPCRVEQLRRVRRETHDPRCGRGELHRRARVVDHFHGGARR